MSLIISLITFLLAFAF